MLENTDKSDAKGFQPEMDDGGRCLLDVINDPQLLQSFLDSSNAATVNNNNKKDEAPSPSSTVNKLEKTPAKKEVKAKKSVVATKSTAVPNTSELNNGNKQQAAAVLTSGNALAGGIIMDNKQTFTMGPGTVGMLPLSITSTLPANAQPINIQPSSLHTSVSLSSNSNTIRASAPAVFPQTQFQLGPRSMTVLPQQLIVPGSPMTQPTGISQFLLTSRPSNSTSSIQGGQVLQIIQTSQGTQILPSTSIQSVVSTTSTLSNKSTSSNARSNKQILPKPQGVSAAQVASVPSKSSAPQANSIKLIQPQTATFNPQSMNSTTNLSTTPQFVIGSGPQSQQIITGPQGTFFLNNVLPNLSSQPFLFQGNVQNQVQLAIRPQAPLFVNNNTLTSDQANLSIALSSNAQVSTSKPQSQPTQPQTFVFSNSNATPVSSSNSVLMAPNIRPNASNIFIRPQFFGTHQPTQPQLLQIQTPNGPILVALNSSPQMTSQPTILGPQMTSQAPPNHIQHNAIQIGNTVISLAANPSMNLQPGANPLQTILTQPQETSALANANIIQPNIATSISTSSPLLINSPSTILSKNPSVISPSSNIQVQAVQPKTSSSKGLNLADLLKETGILSDFSPPASPKNSSFTDTTPQPVASLSESIPPLTNQNSQSTVLMVPGGLNASPNVLLTQNSVASQLRFSLAPDGTLVLLQPGTGMPQAGQAQVQANLISKPDSINSIKDPIGSSQPSPDSTTPSIEATSTSSPSTSVPQSVSSLVTLSATNDKNTPTLSNTFDTALSDNSSFKFVYDKPVASSVIFDGAHNQLIVKTAQNEQNQVSTSLPSQLSAYQNLPSLSVLSTTRNASSCDTSKVVTSCSETISLATHNSSSTSQNSKSLPDLPESINLISANNNAIFSSLSQPNSRVTIADLNGSPLCQTSSSDVEFMGRLEAQLKLLQSLKFTTLQQRELMVELTNIREKLLQPRTIENIALNVQINLSPQAQQVLQLTAKPGLNQQPIALGSSSLGNIILTNNSSSKDNLQILINQSQLNSNTIQLVSSPIVQNAPLSILPQPLTSDTQSNNSTCKASPTLLKEATTPKLNLPQPRLDSEKGRPTVLKAIQQQCNADQNAALHPDCRTPFKSRDDACKRLLRYHVFDTPTWSSTQLNKFDQLYEEVSEILLYQKAQLHNKFRYLLLKQSMRESSVSEQVMLDRMFTQEESSSLKADRELVASGHTLNLPPLPDTWLKLEKLKDKPTLKRKLLGDNFDDELEPNESEKVEITDICNMLEEDRTILNNDLTCDQNVFSNLLSEESRLNTNRNQDIDSVDQLIDQLNSQDATDSSGEHLLTTDHQSFLDSLDNVPLNNSNFIDPNSNSLSMVTDDLEELYSDINTGDQLSQTASNLPWSSNIGCTSMSNTLHNNLLHSSEGSNSRMPWSASFSATEAEAAVAVQSIINPNEETNLSVDLSGIDDLDANIGGDNSVNFDDVVHGEDEEASFLESDPQQQQQGFDVQMHCAIKSIMMPTGMSSMSGTSQSAHFTTSSQSYQYMNNTSMNSSVNYSSGNHSFMSTNMRSSNMMSSYQSSVVNDTMLDEAVKSILS